MQLTGHWNSGNRRCVGTPLVYRFVPSSRECELSIGDGILNYDGVFITLTKCTYVCPYELLVECTKVHPMEYEAGRLSLE